MPPKRPGNDGQSENADLRRQLREAEARTHTLLGAIRLARGSYQFETSMAWIALIAMVLANALAFLWAR
jgi:hypothetical protein